MHGIIQQEHELRLTISRRETYRRHENASLCGRPAEHASGQPARQSWLGQTSAVDSPMALHLARHIPTLAGQALPVRK